MPPDEEDPTEDSTEDDSTETDSEDTGEDPRIAELEAALAASNAQVEALGQALFTYQVSDLGLLADPAAMPYSPDLAGNPDALKAAVLALIASQPDLGRIVVTGDVDQDARDEVQPPATNLLAIMKEML